MPLTCATKAGLMDTGARPPSPRLCGDPRSENGIVQGWDKGWVVRIVLLALRLTLILG